jgi:hypothetical protein
LLIETIVTGGLVSGIGLLAFVLAPVLTIVRCARQAGRFSGPMALVLSGVAIAVLEASVTPTIANSAPFWVALGCAFAVAASASRAGQIGVAPESEVAGIAGDRRSVRLLGGTN